MNTKSKHKIILFDGVCNLCNSSVNFIIRNDKKEVFKFAPIQSDFGEIALKKHRINSKDTDSIILIDDDNYYIKSSAALYIAKESIRSISLFYFVLCLFQNLCEIGFMTLLLKTVTNGMEKKKAV